MKNPQLVLCRCLNSVATFSSVKFKTSRQKTIIRTRMPTRLKTNVQSTLFSLWMNNSNVYHLPFFFCKFFVHNIMKLMLFQLTSMLSSHIQNLLDQRMQLRTKLLGSLSSNLIAIWIDCWKIASSRYGTTKYLCFLEVPWSQMCFCLIYRLIKTFY